MNRLNKYRVWNNDEKCFDNGFWIYQNGGIDHDTALPGAHVVIQQFTGLKDKNMKDIYEGDILKEEWKAPIGDMKETYVIRYGIYETDGFLHLGFYKRYVLRGHQAEGESGGNVYARNNRWEVVGNIFENPELLND